MRPLFININDNCGGSRKSSGVPKVTPNPQPTPTPNPNPAPQPGPSPEITEATHNSGGSGIAQWFQNQLAGIKRTFIDPILHFETGDCIVNYSFDNEIDMYVYKKGINRTTTILDGNKAMNADSLINVFSIDYYDADGNFQYNRQGLLLFGSADIGIASGPKMSGVWAGIGQRSFRISGSSADGTIGIYEDYRSGSSIITSAREFDIFNSMNTFSYVYGLLQGGTVSEKSSSSAEFFSGLFDWYKER